MIKEYYLTGLSFYAIPPSLEGLWHESLFGHCSSRWPRLEEMRELYRISVSDEIPTIFATGGVDLVNEDGVEHLKEYGTIIFDCGFDVLQTLPDTIDVTDTLYSIAWLRDVEHNMFTSWQIRTSYFNDDGKFCIEMKTKHAKNNVYWIGD